MPEGKWRTITVREEIYKTLQNVYERKVKTKRFDKTFTSWVNDLLLENLEDYEILQRYSPALEFLTTTTNTVVIKDYLKDVIAEVELRADDKSLYCKHCATDNCIHIGFCFAIKEVNRVLAKYGFRKPRTITLFGDEEEHKEDEQG